ncbi:MAG: heavy-metal-associated domain-containing protein [Gammaproteobacteria bacterium]|nr:heavy-metal-associated domain-containing protein [Gammaproteobacteria bacterium]
METEIFTVRNVKCGGCVNNIKEGLKPLTNIHNVNVTIEGGLVKVEGDSLSRKKIAQKLDELGYPEA